MVHQQTFKAAIDWMKGNISSLVNTVSISYTNLTNKPSINGVTLEGDKTLDDLNIRTYSLITLSVSGTNATFSRVTTGGIFDITVTGNNIKFLRES